MTAAQRYYRKVIRIRGEDSPNVRYALAELAAGLEPSDKVVVPGVLSYGEYKKRRATWDAIRQCIGLDARFYEGAEILLFPPDWLNQAEVRAARLKGTQRKAKAIGVDPAEGGDKTSMAAIDEYGLLDLQSRRTPDTSAIEDSVIAFGALWNVPPEKWVLDRGGGGKQVADRLRRRGFQCRTVAFGETLTLDPKRGLRQIRERLDNKEDKYAYFNRRAEMYGELSERIDPAYDGIPFAIPAGITGEVGDPRSELRHQLAPIPKTYDKEGRLKLLPKNNPDDDEDSRTLTKLIGHSPDEADALVLALHAMTSKPTKQFAGSAF